MAVKYKHPEKRKGADIYNKQLIRWLITRGFLPKDKNKSVLDLGSGKGHFYFALKEFGYANVFAVDMYPEFKECKKGSTCKKLPYKNGEFDVVISRDVAEHTADHDNFFEEQKRILKKEGIIIVMTPNAEKMSLGQFYEDYTHVMPYTRRSLGQALVSHGFENVYVRRLRAIPLLWGYTYKAFDYLFSTERNNLLGVGKKT